VGKRSWPNLRYPGIYLEGLRRTTKNLIQDSQWPAEIRTGLFPNTSQKNYRLRLFTQSEGIHEFLSRKINHPNIPFP
jgi:hypothetical protein